MTMSGLYALVALFLTVALQGCGNGATYSSMEEALTQICQGSSCGASCRCCVSTLYLMGETCAADIAKGLTPQERNLGHCGTQYWTNQRGECQKYNSTCGEGYMGELS
mmetsp:Transcript_73300/g.161868  ORF Transcript_73300/g.161868 Transcript_73300/m.161868 type:complete len:108 (+) Transcript_73300:82-405(+)